VRRAARGKRADRQQQVPVSVRPQAFRFKAPDDLGGSHGLWADTGTGNRQIGTFWIAPTALPLDVSRGPVETTFKIHLKGVGWSESANIYTVVYDNGHSGYACGFNVETICRFIPFSLMCADCHSCDRHRKSHGICRARSSCSRGAAWHHYF
jgi:hypothetical protein